MTLAVPLARERGLAHNREAWRGYRGFGAPVPGARSISLPTQSPTPGRPGQGRMSGAVLVALFVALAAGAAGGVAGGLTVVLLDDDAPQAPPEGAATPATGEPAPDRACALTDVPSGS